MKPSEYLDKCKIALSVKTDYALANALEIPTQRIADYYKGKRWPDAYACALALKLDPFEVLADIEEQAAKNESRAAFWRGFTGRTRKAAAFLLAALIFGISSMSGDGVTAGAAAVAASAALVILLNRLLRIMAGYGKPAT
ncbi:MAG: hypothetical protein PHD43_22385 [Methylococcales bacterium]|nr:hypothetical protein [Methylococcales bacterium]